jgi:DNA-binding CsgD family transcriptional regulator
MQEVSLAMGVFEHVVRDAVGASSILEFRGVLLSALARLVGADSGSMMDPPWVESDERQARAHTVGLGSSTGYKKMFLEDRHRYARSLARLVRAIRRGGPTVDADVYASRERQRLAIYREILLPQGTSSLLAATLRGRRAEVAIVVFKRHGRAASFGSRQASALRAVLPAIALADAGFRYGLEARRPGRLLAQRLTGREAQVAALASRGLRNCEIAAVLGTSVETTKKQLQSVLSKTEVSNRTELAMLWAASSGGIERS